MSQLLFITVLLKYTFFKAIWSHGAFFFGKYAPLKASCKGQKGHYILLESLPIGQWPKL